MERRNLSLLKLSRRRAGAIAVALLLIWGASGVRRIDGSREFGIVDGPLPGLPHRVDGGWTIAPPGLLRLSRWQRNPQEFALPRADVARIPARDGSRFGMDGVARIEADPERYREIAAAARADREPIAAAAREAGTVLARSRRGAVLLAPAVREFKRAFEEALLRRGLRLRDVTLHGLDWLELAAGEHRPLADRKLLVIGLDGADWAILDPLLAAGQMPNLERLIKAGVRAKLLSISPTISPVVWTSAATGVEPERHGILDFLVPGGRPRAGEPVTSDERLVPTVWEILAQHGVPVGVTAWWASWPAPKIGGYIVSDRLAYQLFGYRAKEGESEGKTWPPELYETLRPKIVAPEDVTWAEVGEYLAGPRRAASEFTREEIDRIDELRTVIASGRTYVDVALEARKRMPPRFEAVYFEGTDTTGHLFMRFRAPRLAEVDDAGFASFREVVDRYYVTADGFIGRLLQDRTDDWTVMVLSDHGFATDETRPRTTDPRIGHGPAADWHRKFGMLVVSGAGVIPGATLAEAKIYDIAPTILALFGEAIPKSWPGRVLGEIIEPEFLDSHPVLYTADEPAPRSVAAASAADPQAEETLEKLRSLGYLAAQPTESRDPSPVSASNNRGVALMAEGRFEEAAAAFRAALETTPNAPSLMVNLGIALSFTDRKDEAIRYLQTAFAHLPTRRPAGLRLAQVHLKAGDLDAAEKVLRKVLEIEPGAADIRNTLGVVLEKAGDLSAARAEFLEAARLDPNAADPRNNLGNIARDAGQQDEAETWYRDAIEADPYFMGAYNNLALVYQDRGESGRAIDLYSRALEKAPRNAVVMNNLASLYFAQGDDAEARRLWEEAAETDPSYVSPLNNLAGLALTEKRFDDAERLLQQALEKEPGYGDARVNLSLVHRARGDVDAAREDLALAARDPRSTRTALYQLGVLELGAGRPDAALAALESARRQGPDADLLKLLGEAYRRLGRRQQAREAWMLSLKIRPGQADVSSALQNLDKQE